MDRKLTPKEYIVLASMLFGMFFGAGNLIFPVSMGQQAGANLWPAIVGFCLTGVGLPLLGIAAMGISRSEGLFDMCSRVGRPYSYFFTCLLYLSIGPLFAIPRTATVSFSVGILPLIPAENSKLVLCVFSALFFAAVLFFSLRPSGIMTWIGKILNPLFLLFLGILTVTALMNPMGGTYAGEPTGNYAEMSFFQGFLEGYNTLDALAGLAFGIVVIDVVREHGVKEPGRIAVNTARAGIFSCLFMGLIYLFITLVSAQSAPICAGCTNGGEALGVIADYYFHSLGAILTAAIVTFACLKTAIGLVTSCSKAFVDMFPKGPGYRTWAILFSAASFGIANFGLNSIVAWCVPVLMFLYPLAITLILLALFGKFFGHSRTVYVWTTGFTLIAAIFDMIGVVSGMAPGSTVLAALTAFAQRIIPFFSLGLGWLCPAAIGFLIGMLLRKKEQ